MTIKEIWYTGRRRVQPGQLSTTEVMGLTATPNYVGKRRSGK